jgi:hypothetical protein
LKYIAVILGTSVLAACGGGGGDSVATAQSVSTTAVLTSANQDVVAQDTATAANVPLSSAELLTGAQVTDEGVVFNVMRGQITKLPTYIASMKANSTVTGVVESETWSCSRGGSLTATGTDADNNGIASAGDRVTLTSNGCVEAEGAMSGSIDFAITNLSGDFGSTNYSAAMTIAFNNFAVATSQLSANVNGAMTFSTNVSGANASTTTVSSPSLAVSGTYAGVARTRTLTNYSASVQRRPDPTYNYVTSYSLSGFLTSSSISNQTIAFSTPTPLVTRSTSYYPSSGVMLITGTNSSKLRVTALSNTQVIEELDANGDGTYESTKTVSWNTLM